MDRLRIPADTTSFPATRSTFEVCILQFAGGVLGFDMSLRRFLTGAGGNGKVQLQGDAAYRIRYSFLGYPSTKRAPSGVTTACSSRPMDTSTPPHSGMSAATENSME